MKTKIKQFFCLMLTVHVDSELVGDVWDIPVTYRCRRCGATISF